MFSGKTRIQADNADSFSTVAFGIKVDGLAVGANSVQQLAQGAGQASRTLTTSYLSAPGSTTGPLLPGIHTVEVFINMQGANLRFPSVPQDLVLTYFD